MNAFKVVRDFEYEVCTYTGAPFAVAVNSCTNALFLCLHWYGRRYKYSNLKVEIPKLTYVSVPQQIIHAGFMPTFRDEDWQGMYQLKPFPIWDAARRFTSKMYVGPMYDNGGPDKDLFMCTSHHWSKPLGIQQGGMILHNNREIDSWFRRMRFDGRTEGIHPKEDKINEAGFHMYMSPEIAAEGLVRLSHLKKDNLDLPRDDYPDLSTIFSWSIVK